MKRILLISLTAILSIGSLAPIATAHPHHDRTDGYEYEEEQAPKPAEPLRYRTQLPAEPEETNEDRDHDRRRQHTDRYDQDDYRRERRRSHRYRRHHHGTRNDPGRY
jgi:hypothetical protein